MLTKNAEALQNTEALHEITPYGLTRHGEPGANRYIGAPAIKSAEYPKSPNPAITVAGPCPLIPLSAPRRRGALWLLLLNRWPGRYWSGCCIRFYGFACRVALFCAVHCRDHPAARDQMLR
jgi:hypothetical protein